MLFKAYINRVTRQPWVHISIVLLFAIIVFVAGRYPATGTKLSTFSTVFLGIFIEALPFLLLGTLASGLVEVYLDAQTLHRYVPRSKFLSALSGGLLGLIFPVCECGVVPLVRRLWKKGFPIPAGIAFLLSAPVINPIVIFSTATAFGFGKILLMRVGFTLLIAVITALIFSVDGAEEMLLQTSLPQESCCTVAHHSHDFHNPIAPVTHTQKIQQALQITLDEFFEIGRYLILGGMIAAAMQTFVPQSALLAIANGPLLSILIMMLLAFVLSICSTVDSFVALGFAGIFSTPAILAFLLFGPMADIKSTLLFLRLVKPRAVLYIIMIPMLLVVLTTYSLTLFGVW